MRKLYVASLMILTACEQQVTVRGNALSVIDESIQTPENIIETYESFVTVQNMSTQYLYVLHGNFVRLLPIDSDGELIFPDSGYYISAPASIIDMKMHPSKKFLYLVSNTSNQYYVYGLSDLVYPQEVPTLPAQLLSYGNAGQAPQGIALGDNNSAFFQVYNTLAQRFEINVTTGALKYKTSTSVGAAQNAPYNAQFAHTTQIVNGTHTYEIDAQTNQIIHSIDGVIQSSKGFDDGGYSEIKSLAIR